MKVSIITATYNSAATLRDTLDSVLAQTYQDIEYIIVDGLSADGTQEIVKAYEPRFGGRLRLVSEKDKGLYDAMNKGLRKATGDYVWFLNAGDTLYTADTLQTIVSKLKKSSALPDVLYGETQIVDAQSRALGMRRLKAPRKLTWKSFRMGMLVCHQSFVMKRELAPEYDTSYRLVADYEWCIRCLKRAKRIKHTHLILSNYLEEGLSTANRKASLKERYAVMCRYYGKVTTVLLHGWFAMRFYAAKWFKGRV